MPDSLPWVLMIMAWLFLLAKECQNYIFSRKHTTTICQYEWCSFVSSATRNQAELAYYAMNQHLLHEHESGPWAHAVPPSSD